MADASIKLVVKGNTPSLLDTEKANEVIEGVNKFLLLKVNPQGFGKLTLGEKNAILDLTPLKTLIDQLSTVVAAFSQANGGGGAGGGGGGGGGSNAWKGPYNALLNALANSSLSAECDPDTRVITITWDIDLPPAQ